MIISSTRASPFFSQCQWGAVSRNVIYYSCRRLLVSSFTDGGSVSKSSASYRSLAPQQLQSPLRSYNSCRASSSPMDGSSNTNPIASLLSNNTNLYVWDDATTEKEESRRIRNLQDFVDRIPAAVNLRKIKNIQPGEFEDPVARLFRQTDLPSHTWQKYALFDKNKQYTRNLISTDNKTYTLLLLCWNPGQESPIHDHPCDGCWLQVLEGVVREVRYDKKLSRVSQMDCHEGELSYITDNVGYHKVGNPCFQTPAVTLHLYAPPFESCRCWHSETADPSEPSEGKNVNHSEYGVLNIV